MNTAFIPLTTQICPARLDSFHYPFLAILRRLGKADTIPFSANRFVTSGKTVMTLQVLALNAYHGGSHRAFLDGWSARSRHNFTTLTLPAHKWKWRMRHAAVSFSEMLHELDFDVRDFDVVFCTDMLNLAEFRGLCPACIRNLPTVVYFHENQLTYPRRVGDERDLHFAFTNFTSCLSAEAVWFNSEFHRKEFLSGCADWLKRMPDFQPNHRVASIAEKSAVQYPGVDSVGPISEKKSADQPLHIVWVSRWEHDKAPEKYFAALRHLQCSGVDFRVSMLGESFREILPCFDEAKHELGDRILRWGYVDSRVEYQGILRDADVVVSTALHEFFGIAIVEAVSAGCLPLTPNRLAYPEVLGPDSRFFCDDSPDDLAAKLRSVANPKRLRALRESRDQTAESVARFDWKISVPMLDDALQRVQL